MVTKLNKPVTRAIVVDSAYKKAGEINVTVSMHGVTFHKGRRKMPIISWEAIAKHSTMPDKAPARFTGDQLGWLLELSHGADDNTTVHT